MNSALALLPPLKKIFLAGVLLCAFLLASCAHFRTAGDHVKVWWEKPSTQLAIQTAQSLAFQLAYNLALAAAGQYGATGKVDFQGAAITAGANTLYQQASALRQIQGTQVVVDPIAMAKVLEANGTTGETARAIASILASNARMLVERGVDPDKASEIQANEFDQAAAFILGAPDIH